MATECLCDVRYNVIYKQSLSEVFICWLKNIISILQEFKEKYTMSKPLGRSVCACPINNTPNSGHVKNNVIAIFVLTRGVVHFLEVCISVRKSTLISSSDSRL